MNNDGYFRVPASNFTQWKDGDYVLVTISAVQEGTSKLLFNGSDFRVAGIHSTTGAFWTQPD